MVVGVLCVCVCVCVSVCVVGFLCVCVCVVFLCPRLAMARYPRLKTSFKEEHLFLAEGSYIIKRRYR